MKNRYLLMLALFLLLAIGLQAQSAIIKGRGLIVHYDYNGALSNISTEATQLKRILDSDSIYCEILPNPTQAELLARINSEIELTVASGTADRVLFLYLRGYGVYSGTALQSGILHRIPATNAAPEIISLNEVEAVLQRALPRGVKPVVVLDLIYSNSAPGLGILNAWSSGFTTLYNHRPNSPFTDAQTKRLINTLNMKLSQQSTEIRFGDLFEIVSQSVSSEFNSNAPVIQRPYVQPSRSYVAYFRRPINSGTTTVQCDNPFIPQKIRSDKLLQWAKHNPEITAISATGIAGGTIFLLWKLISSFGKGPSKLPGPPVPPPN